MEAILNEYLNTIDPVVFGFAEFERELMPVKLSYNELFVGLEPFVDGLFYRIRQLKAFDESLVGSYESYILDLINVIKE